MASVSSTTTSSLTQYVASISSLDTNGDGVVSAEEQAAATRTQDPTVSTDSAATSSTSLLSGDMMAMVLAKGDPSSTEASAQVSRFDAMDSDGDGKVSEKEFVASRPNDVSEEDAAKLFSSLDADNTGTLSEEQLQQQKPPAPPMGGMQGMEGLSSILSADSDSEDTMSMEDVMSQMSSVIAAYRSAGGTADETTTAEAVAATTEKVEETLTV